MSASLSLFQMTRGATSVHALCIHSHSPHHLSIHNVPCTNTAEDELNVRVFVKIAAHDYVDQRGVGYARLVPLGTGPRHALMHGAASPTTLGDTAVNVPHTDLRDGSKNYSAGKGSHCASHVLTSPWRGASSE